MKMHCFKSVGERKRCLALISDWDTPTSFQTEARALERRPGKLNCVVQQVTVFPKTRVMMKYVPPDHLTVASCPLDAFLSLAYSMS